jgi:long-chain acyl-CoA synthetase
MAILSSNRAHWVLADLAIQRSGNVTIPIFTTVLKDHVEYVLSFAEVKVLFVGEADNWEKVRGAIPDSVRIITLPGVEIEEPHQTWDDVLANSASLLPKSVIEADRIGTIIFTSGTTGKPKGVTQSHNSLILPMEYASVAWDLGEAPRFFSYLPLAHIAERSLVETNALVTGGTITFNEAMPQLVRDLAQCRPSYFFGPPRVWEQLQQVLLSLFGGQSELDALLSRYPHDTAVRAQAAIGLADARYLLTAAAPTPPALIEWFEQLGIVIMEGYGQTEAMILLANRQDARRIGSIGCRIPGSGFTVKVDENGEVIASGPGLAEGYLKMPDQTRETFRDGWVHTGDKGYEDADGYFFLTGRTKDIFKTIHGKYVAPAPIESAFAECGVTAQVSLLGRGYSKTVMVGVLSDAAARLPTDQIESRLRDEVEHINQQIEHHARIGVVMLTREPWTIESGVLTPTLKIKRDEVEKRFGDQAMMLARRSAEQHEIIVLTA